MNPLSQLTMDRDGWVAPGHYVLEDTIRLGAGQALRCDGVATLEGPPNMKCVELVGPDALFEGIHIASGSLGLNFADGAKRCVARRFRIVNTLSVGLWIGDCEDCHVDAGFVANTGDNLCQIEHGGVLISNSAFVRGGLPQGALPPNKLLDCTHGEQRNVRIENCTFLSVEAYGVGLEGWTDGPDRLFANNIVIVYPPGEGQGGYAVHAPNLKNWPPDGEPQIAQACRFGGNVGFGAAPEGVLDRQWTDLKSAVSSFAGTALPRGLEQLAPKDASQLQVGAGLPSYSWRFDALGHVRARPLCAGAVEFVARRA